MAKQKTLYIIRHGKSSWDYAGIADIDRPLNDRGIRDAYTMANRLLMLETKPDLILSSPATRAIHTSLIFSRVLEVDPSKININQDIYYKGNYDVLELIKKTNDQVNTLFIFGHNPTFTDLANLFVKNYLDNIPTAGMVSLKFDTGAWHEVFKGNMVFESFDYPKKK